MLLLVLAACGFAGALATRLLDPLLTLVAADFGTTAAAVAVLSTALALPFGPSQPLLGPLGDSVGKTRMIKVGVATLAFCLIGSALASSLTMLFLARILGGIAAGAIMPVCMAVIGDRFPIALRQVAMSRYVGATLVGQLVGASAGGVVAEWIGWRGVMGCAAALAAVAATAAILFLPKADQPSSPLRIDEALRRYRLVLMNPRSLVCFGVVFIEGLAIYGITPFIGQMLQERGAGGNTPSGVRDCRARARRHPVRVVSSDHSQNCQPANHDGGRGRDRSVRARRRRSGLAVDGPDGLHDRTRVWFLLAT